MLLLPPLQRGGVFLGLFSPMATDSDAYLQASIGWTCFVRSATIFLHVRTYTFSHIGDT